MKRMLTKRIFCFILLLLILNSCGIPPDENTPQPTGSPTVQATLIPTLIPTTTAPPTAESTQIPSTSPIPTALPTSTVIPIDGIEQTCVEFVEPFQESAINPGVIIYEGKYPNIYWQDLTTGEVITTTHGINFRVSPDKTLVAYIQLTEREGGAGTALTGLIISGPDGQPVQTFPWEADWADIVGWSDNQHVLITLDTYNGERIELLTEPAPLLVLDITNGEREVINPDFPSFLEPVSVLPEWNGLFGISYNSTLTRAIYLSDLENPDDMYTYGLLDVTKNQRLALLDSFFTEYDFDENYPTPVWSEDGAFAIMVGMTPHTSQSVNQTTIYEIYKINIDGSYEQLTHLWPGITYIHEGISLSPDNQHLVFYVNPEGNKEVSKGNLIVLNLSTNTISDYCLDIHQVFSYPRPAIWSPDSSQFIVVNRFGQGRPRAILVDIVNKTASILAEDMEPVGWILSP